ncbi:MAG: META domain-containing protein [Candidatus Cyclonatronum sp.]|uniref:META domain-containing protein n=1 Tax=Cyclonatronum sp. TaxID=3024185 RepID=UPI0025C1711C|nr:META domain-containing protein [Cyclonatronum sp.]MCH8487644.1 META domain-containing protein [Cyclonatronum sp.]
MMKKIQIFAAFAALLFFAAACDSPETQTTDAASMQQAEPEQITQEVLADSPWLLVNLFGEEFTLEMEGLRQPGITFDAEEGRVHGFAGCNQFTGGFSVAEGRELSFTQMASTKMACPDMEVEDRYFKALEQTARVSLVEGRMQFEDREGAVVAVFFAEPDGL